MFGGSLDFLTGHMEFLGKKERGFMGILRICGDDTGMTGVPLRRKKEP